MMRPKRDVQAGIPAETSIVSFAVVPVAIPLLAGPGAISSVIVFTGLHEGASHRLLVMAVIVSVSAILYLVLRVAPLVSRVIGRTGLAVFERVMGLIIAAIGVEFILDGIAGHFPQIDAIHL
jgi:multiple antibiotic resistance protein